MAIVTINYPLDLQVGFTSAATTSTFNVARGYPTTFDVASDSAVTALGTTFSNWQTTADNFTIDNSTGVLTADFNPHTTGDPTSISVFVSIDGTETLITVPTNVRYAVWRDFIPTTDPNLNLVSYYSCVQSVDGTARNLMDVQIRDRGLSNPQTITLRSDATGLLVTTPLDDALDVYSDETCIVRATRLYDQGDSGIHVTNTGINRAALFQVRDDGVDTKFYDAFGRRILKGTWTVTDYDNFINEAYDTPGSRYSGQDTSASAVLIGTNTIFAYICDRDMSYSALLGLGDGNFTPGFRVIYGHNYRAQFEGPGNDPFGIRVSDTYASDRQFTWGARFARTGGYEDEVGFYSLDNHHERYASTLDNTALHTGTGRTVRWQQTDWGASAFLTTNNAQGETDWENRVPNIANAIAGFWAQQNRNYS